MKRNPRVLFLCLLASILFAPWLHSQPISKYPYGMYVYGNNGIYYDAGTLKHWKNSSGQNLMEFWRSNLKMNYFSTFEGNWGPYWYLNNSYSNYIKNGDIKYVYRASRVIDKAEGHYLKFNIANKTLNSITFPSTNNNYTRTELSDGYKFTARYTFPDYINIINGINVIGTDNNRRVIRPRAFNTTKINNTTRISSFHIAFEITNLVGTNTELYVVLSNKNKTNVSGDPNDMAQDTTIALNTLGKKRYIMNFQLDEDYVTPNDDAIQSAYQYAPDLNIDCIMDARSSFTINSIILYDDAGFDVIEGGYLSSTDFNNFVTGINSNYPNVNFEQIFELHDEPTVGNFQPAKAIADYLRAHITIGKFSLFATGIELDPEDPVQFSAITNRYFDEVARDTISQGTFYYAPDYYNFGWKDDTTSISIYNTNIVNETHLRLKGITDIIRSRNLPIIPVDIIQIFEQTNRWRKPTKNEIIASAYVGLLNGYKGILYWVGGPQLDNLAIKGLYPNVDTAIYKQEAQNFSNYMFNSSNMIAYKKNAINKVASFLNQQSTTTGGNFILGDLLSAGNFQDAKIVGYPANTTTMTLGELAKAQLVQVDILDPSTWDVSTANDNLIGVNSFSITGDNATYFLFTNLNKDGHLSKIRLSFKTTNTANFLRTYVLTNVDDHAGRLYPNNGIIVTEVPQDGVLLLRIVNTNTDESVDFPKGTRFGVARTENNTTKIVLDTDFRSQANVLEKIIINTNLNAEVISLYNKDVSTGKTFTDFATFRVLNYSYNGTTSMQIEFKKYLQNSDGTFTAQSPATYIVPRPNAASTAYKVKSLSYDSDNDGIDEMGYCIAYNNRYFIYTFNGTGFTQRKVFPGSTPSAAPEYFNLDATVLAAKWGGYSTIYIYNPANHCFYMDKDRDLQINLTTEKQPMGGWFANWSPMPYTGDWYGDATWEYGVYEFDKPFGWTQFNLNNSHTDGWSWFEFPYGNGYPTDKPLVWKPRTLSAPKSAGETIEEAAEIPSEYSISQNFPNPFNPATTIRFALPAESRVTLEVFNILGERVAELVNDVRPAGTMDVRFDGSNLASGIYIYKFNATSIENGKHFQKINKMLLLK
jgi:hypothetical protein